MPFRMLTQCTDCDEIVERCDDHDCPNDPMKDPVKRAAHEAWEAEFDKNYESWEAYQDNRGETKVAYPSVREYPNEVAFEGRCIIFDEGGDCENYVSDVLENPTWGDLLYLFDAAIEKTKDQHHSFMEGHYQIDEVPDWIEVPKGVTVLRFATGS